MYSLSSRCMINGTPCEPALDPNDLESGKALRQAIHDPIGEMNDIEKRKSERVHRYKFVGRGKHLVVPIVCRMKCDREFTLFEHRIKFHIAGIIDRLVSC